MRSTVRPNQDQLDDLLLQVMPAQGRWSDDEYLWLTDRTNHPIELTDGYLEVLPLPTDRHQVILLHLYRELFAANRGGAVLVTPMRLRIRQGKYREPDLLVLLDTRDPRRGNRFWAGADLVVEIVSPDKPERDHVDKRLDYAEAGVAHYWIVDPQTESVTTLVLEGQNYREQAKLGRGDRLTSAFVSLELNAIFDAQ